MDEHRRLSMVALPALMQPPPDDIKFIRQQVLTLAMLVKPPPDQSLTIRERIIGNNVHFWNGRDVFTSFASNRYSFFEVTGETPETLLQIVADVNVLFRQRTGRNHTLSPRNRILLFMLWLRSYPSYHMLSVIFDVSVSTIKDEIHACIPIFEETYSRLIHWPSLDEWQDLQGGWGKLPFAVGAIDGTSTEIYRPITEPQEQYYSGHRQYHCIHTQVVISNEGRICYVECGFLGHQNDAQQYMLMRNIGQQLPFPDELFLLGDKIYPNRHQY
ncbi:unnamed protein product [Mytilus edulis]|uniref:DDE Tnp4 domain-containing protein n=1 Tax=Mytilus edulis TaxID=6550 RepID=A0A8S3V3G3_MYTED|nr:unnamed protein product [Mytilus edulis]